MPAWGGSANWGPYREAWLVDYAGAG